MSKLEDWCRIFTVGTKLVVFMLVFNPEDEDYRITTSYHNDDLGAFVEMKMTFDVDDETAQDIFSKGATQETAEKVLGGDGLRAWGI